MQKGTNEMPTLAPRYGVVLVDTKKSKAYQCCDSLERQAIRKSNSVGRVAS